MSLKCEGGKVEGACTVNVGAVCPKPLYGVHVNTVG